MGGRGRIAVIGGGPAGATCAFMLAAGGADVTLFESRPAGEKPCGGGIPGHALRIFPELDDPALPRRIVREAVIYAPSNLSARVPLPGGMHMFRRADLDSFLRDRARRAGSALVHASVRSVRRVGGRAWELATSEGDCGPFDFLVGADGVRSVVRRSVAGPFPDAELTLALYAYVPGVPRPEVVIKFCAGMNGYLWAFPRTDHVSVGICGSHRSVSAARLREAMWRFVDEHYPEARAGRATLKGYFIPASPSPPAAHPGRDGAGNWALIGDAGGFVDPMTREGIAHAMASGASLARRLLGAGQATTPPLPAKLAWAHAHGPGFYQARFLERMALLAAASPAIRGVLADLLSGKQDYHGLRRRLLLNAVPSAFDLGFGGILDILRAGRGRVPARDRRPGSTRRPDRSRRRIG